MKEINVLNIFSVECLVNSDCPPTSACVQQECINPCHHISCGDRAVCNVEKHVAYCDCPPGMQGNPVVGCEEVGCLRDEDCDQREKCDYTSQRCVPLCRGQVCAPGAECFAFNHREDCRCRAPLQGNGFGFCEARKLQKNLVT